MAEDVSAVMAAAVFAVSSIVKAAAAGSVMASKSRVVVVVGAIVDLDRSDISFSDG